MANGNNSTFLRLRLLGMPHPNGAMTQRVQSTAKMNHREKLIIGFHWFSLEIILSRF
jgi:hypothetical protein